MEIGLGTVVESHFESVGVGVPDLDSAIFRGYSIVSKTTGEVVVRDTGDNDRDVRVEENARDVVSVSLESLDALLRLVIPDLDQPSRGKRLGNFQI